MMMKTVRKHFECYGEVQGVGFRWICRQSASACGVTGWVRNEYDGSVTLELQGSEEQIAGVIDMLKKDSWIRIRHMDVREAPVDGEERSFRVRY